MHASDALDRSIERTGSIACVGLDPRPSLLPASLRHSVTASHGPGAEGVAEAFRISNEAIIDAVAGHCAVIKPQAACYEAYGVPGWRALEATVAHAEAAGVPVILDAKRGDIGSTAAHYGQMAFGGAPGLDDEPISGMDATWLTVNPYLGVDGIEPVLGDSNAGLFVITKTSNPSSGELQDTPSGAGTVADTVADLVHGWGATRLGDCGLSDIGAVVGATYPDHARALRERMPDTFFLVPGYGAQGGDAAGAVAGLRSDGRGIVVSSSRGITGAWQATGTDDWAGAARAALDDMNRALDAVRR
ncbi:orotidine-5'-phosphate decarboxylase [Actinospongicola halichondriae]|uniref:orotidine-5'-phosphate decarboxylase n=1 Tax=Actinospongicola halichondriae TaxID=3236844 RepID=UPI003D4BFD47